jgi:hypothetical protein
MAVRSGGKGDVAATHQVWSLRNGNRIGTNVSSPVYHDGHLYWVNTDSLALCVDVRKGTVVYQGQLDAGHGTIYASPVVADGKLYHVTRQHGTFVLPAAPRFEVLARNRIATDDSVFNASPVPIPGPAGKDAKGRLLLRSDRFLYCIGGK